VSTYELGVPGIAVETELLDYASYENGVRENSAALLGRDRDNSWMVFYLLPEGRVGCHPFRYTLEISEGVKKAQAHLS
jgi:hypothetical protein